MRVVVGPARGQQPLEPDPGALNLDRVQAIKVAVEIGEGALELVPGLVWVGLCLAHAIV